MKKKFLIALGILVVAALVGGLTWYMQGGELKGFMKLPTRNPGMQKQLPGQGMVKKIPDGAGKVSLIKIFNVTANSAYGSQRIVSGAAHVKFGSFIIQAPGNEDINIQSVTFNINESVISTGGAMGISNISLYKYVDGTNDIQISNTLSTIADNANATLPIIGQTIAKNQQIQVDIYGVTSEALSTHALTTTISANGVSGTGVTSRSNKTAPAAALQLPSVITGTLGGTLTISLANDNSNIKQFVAGSSENPMLKLRLQANIVEDIYVKEITIFNDSDVNDIALASLSLRQAGNFPIDGQTAGIDQLLGVSSIQQNGGNPGYFTWTFSGNNRPKVSLNSKLDLIVNGNLVSSQQASVSGKAPKLTLTSIKAEDALGNREIIPVIQGNVSGNTMYVYNTKPSVAADTSQLDSSFKSEMKLAQVVFSAAANPADTNENSIALHHLDITFEKTRACLTNSKLYPADKYNDERYAMPGILISSSNAKDVVRFNILSTEGLNKITEGNSRKYVLKADTTNGTNGSLIIKLQNRGTAQQAGDLEWDDGQSTVKWIDIFSSQSVGSVELRNIRQASANGTCNQ